MAALSISLRPTHAEGKIPLAVFSALLLTIGARPAHNKHAHDESRQRYLLFGGVWAGAALPLLLVSIETETCFLDIMQAPSGAKVVILSKGLVFEARSNSLCSAPCLRFLVICVS
jgi:hypothetical protein